MTGTTSASPPPTVGGAGARVPRVPWQAKYLALALIWGSSFLLMKVGLAALAPLQVSATRILTGTVTLLVLLGLAGGRLPADRRTWGHLTVTGLFLTTLPFSLFAAAEERITSALTGIGNATTPLASVVVGFLLLPADRLPPRRLAAVLVGFLGVLVILQPWEAAGRPDPLGFAMALAAACCYGIGWTYSRRALAGSDLGGLSLPAGTLVAGTVQMVPVVAAWWWLHRDAFPTPWAVRPDATTAGAGPLLAVLALGAVGTGLAYMFQFDVVRAAGPTVGTTVTYLIPVVSVLLGVLVLGERMARPQVLGAVVVVSAAVALGRLPRPGRLRRRRAA